MPVQYSGLVEEHETVRNAVGLFDVSHMGELTVRGVDAEKFLDRITCNRVSDLEISKAQYSMLLNHQGGVVDDIIIYKIADNDFLLCVNASNTEKDFNWVVSQQKALTDMSVEVENVSADYAQIAIQGPLAQQVLEEVVGVETLALNNVKNNPKCLIARTGYTGEDGFEVFCAPAEAEDIARAMLVKGESVGIKPAGLGARDTLRLEACYPLHGHEISDDISPLEAGLGWVVKLDKADFIGKNVLVAQKESGLTRRLVGLEVLDKGIVREGAALLSGSEKVGWVTSGTKPPTVNKAVALAIVNSDSAKLNTEILAEVRTRQLKTKVIKRPFYKRS
ncbi:UNVERIFIED_CONTAM: hypothetical protein GTU68_027370 [Idotea baltica]|nr:hypothetical protein [Idotea baltica]